MTDPANTKSDCYGHSDRKIMELSQKIRGLVLSPFLTLLTWGHIRPNHVSLISLILGWCACVFLFISLPAALTILFFHVIFDGLDGPLARFQKKESNAGSFVDTLVDQIVIASLAIALMHKGTLGIIPGGIYIFLYTGVITFSMVRNAMKIPYLWIIRPRFLVYFWLIFEFTLLPGSLNIVVWICNIILTVNCQDGFRHLKKGIQ